MTKLIAAQKYFICYWLFYFLPLIICGLRYIQTFTLITILRRRLETIQTILNNFNFVPRQNSSLIINSNETKTFTMSEDLQKRDEEKCLLNQFAAIRDIYDRLWESSVLFNKTFGLSILTNIANDCISITTSVYWIFLNVTEYDNSMLNNLLIFGSIVWIVPHLVNLLLLVTICSSTTEIASTDNYF